MAVEFGALIYPGRFHVSCSVLTSVNNINQGLTCKNNSAEKQAPHN